jgi:hypothetical protein
MKELFGWPKHDANWILIIEFALMMAFFKMNAADWVLQQRGLLPEHGSFPISSTVLGPVFSFGDGFLFFTEKGLGGFTLSESYSS